ncbi:MAG: hypothetical protein Cons2KO_34840 [Congregibacter sp.]
MSQTKEADAVIGEDCFLRLHRLLERIAKRHGLSPERAADYLLTGALFVASDAYDCNLEETLEIAQTLSASLQLDDLPAATRH